MRTFQSIQQPIQIKVDQLPLDQPIAVYYRQSTTAQVGNISTSIQTIDMVEVLKQRGWADDMILLIDMDAGVSGTLKIDEREGMNQLFSMICNGTIGAVACQDEDRLFRDVTQIQVNIFIDACLRHQVQVITPAITYIFHHQTMGEFYKKQFRYKCEVAAEYLNFLKGRLGGARDRVMREGKYGGGRLPLGYMIDANEKSPTYHKLIRWTEIAKITHRVFELFVETGGHIRTTESLLHHYGICYPTLETPQGFYFPPNGFPKTGYLAPASIRNMMTNPVFIGHWLHKGAVLRWNNHEPIIEEELFFQAFNHISPYNLDGSPNLNFTVVNERIRHPEYQEQRPLLTGMIYADNHRLTANQHSRGYFIYQFTDWQNDTRTALKRRADSIDGLVQDVVLERLRTSFDPKRFQETVELQIHSGESEVNEWQERITSLQKQQQNIIDAVSRATLPIFIEKLEANYQQVNEEIVRSQVKLSELHNKQERIRRLYSLKDIYLQAIDSWPQATREEKRQIITRMIDRIDVIQWEHRYLTLVISWQDATQSEHTIWMRKGSWTYDQLALLRTMMSETKSHQEIKAAFPGKTWAALHKTIQRLTKEDSNEIASTRSFSNNVIYPFPLSLL